MEDAASVCVRFRCMRCQQEQDMYPTPEATQAVLDCVRRGTMMCDWCFAVSSTRITLMVHDLFREVE